MSLPTLQDDLKMLSTLVDLNGMASESLDQRSVSNYYRWTNWFYRKLHSAEGAMHFPLYLPGKATNHYEGLTEQARLVSEYCKPHQHAVEIGCGSGYNLRQLVQLIPTLRGTGIDATPLHVQQAKQLANKMEHSLLSFQQGFFSNLPVADNSCDVVFAVESFCYSTNLRADVMEVHRILKPGGWFIVFDLFRQPFFDTVSDQMKFASLLTARGFAFEEWPKIDQWLASVHATGFSTRAAIDLSAAVSPNLMRMQHDTRKWLTRLSAIPWVAKLIPQALLRHGISGLLSSHLMQTEVHGYYQVVLQKS